MSWRNSYVRKLKGLTQHKRSWRTENRLGFTNQQAAALWRWYRWHG